MSRDTPGPVPQYARAVRGTLLPNRIGAQNRHEITTGPVEPGALSSGGLYKRHQKEPILSFVQVGDIESVVSKVEELGGKVMMPISEIPGVGLTAMILDTENNMIGIWMPAGA